MIERVYLKDKSFEDLDRIITDIMYDDNLSDYEKKLRIEATVVIPLLDEIDNLRESNNKK